jgi:AcrR family transcriptional regulator
MVEHRSLREKQRQEREHLILQATEEVLLEKGYHEMSMDEIASRVGIAKGTLYLHFARKEDLVCALIERQTLDLLHTLEQLDTMPGSAQEKLTSIAQAMYEGMGGKRMQILYALHNSFDFKSVLKERHWDIMHSIAQRITTLLEEGKAHGEFDTTVPTPVMLNTLFSMLSPLSYRRLVVDQAMTPEDVVHYMLRIYFRGIVVSEGKDNEA